MSTSRILYIFWKIIGLCPFNVKKNRKIKFSQIGAFYSTILTIFYTIVCVRAMNNRLKFLKPRETPISLIADIVAKSTQCLMTITTWLSFGFGQKKLYNFQKRFLKIFKSCEIIGIQEYPRNIIKNIKIQVVTLNSLWTIVFIFGHFQHGKSPFYELGLWVQFNFGRIIYPNFTVIFVAAMCLIRDRFRSLNDKIRELSCNYSTKRNRVRVTRRGNSSKKNGIECLSESDPLAACIQVYSELVDLTTSVVEFSSLMLYLTMAIYVFELSSSFYDVCLNIKHEKFWSTEENGYILALSFWFTFQVVGLIALFAVPDSTTKEANKTANVLHEFFIFDSSKKHVNLATMQSLKLLQRRLTIQIFGLLPIKLSMVYTISSIVITYITIMIQLDDQERERHKVHKLLDD